MTPAASTGDGPTGTGYALRLSEAELARYRSNAERARTEEADLWRTAGIVEGARVVDLGCGPGAVPVVMAERVGPAGDVTGIDSDLEAVAAAREAIVAAGVGSATVRVGEAVASDLDPGSMDVAVLRLVLAHN
jgi:tRNA A58 N-methylase Trm61